VIAGLLIAACSSSKPGTGSVDAHFLAVATTACDGALQQVAPYPFPYTSFDDTNPLLTELPGAAAYYNAQPFNHKELGFVKSLGKPKQGGKTWSQFVDLVSRQQAAVGREITTGKAADKAGFVAAAQQVAAIGQQVRTIGAAVGFKPQASCILLFG
jgi:hypothetical protein